MPEPHHRIPTSQHALISELLDPATHTIERVLALLRLQVSEIGPRPVGSSTSAQLRDFLQGYLEALGLSVRRERFMVEAYRSRAAQVEINGQVRRAMPFLGAPGYVPFARTFDADLQLAEHMQLASGKAMVFCGSPQDWPETIAVAAQTGVGALLLDTGATDDTRVLAPVFPFQMPALDELLSQCCLPILGVSSPLAMDLALRAAQGERVGLSLDVTVAPTEAVTLRASRPGGPARHWVLCHVDSAFEDEDLLAANDNASGVAALCAAMAEMSMRGDLPEDTEWIFYDAEEYGLLGCIALLLDLPEIARRTPDKKLYRLLHEGGLAPEVIRALPDRVTEIDAVGQGRVLHLGASDPKALADSLKRRQLGVTFEAIRLGQQEGNLQYAARLLGLQPQTDFRFVTLGNSDTAHTPLDTLDRIEPEDTSRVVQFLAAFLAPTSISSAAF